VKQLFGTRSQTRRSSRKKKNKTNLADSSTAKTDHPPAESSPSQHDDLQTTKTQEEDPPADPTSTKAGDSPAHSSLTQADDPPADLSPSPIDSTKTKEDDPPSDQAKTKADDAKADSPKKIAIDHLPPSSNERKKPPNLEAKIPRKNRKAKESLPGNKMVGDDPLSRIDPSLPLVPVARLPGKKAENVVDAGGQEEEPPMPPSSSKGTTARLSPQDRRRKQQLLLKKKAATKKQVEVVATAMAMANLSMDADEPSDTESEDVNEIAKSKAAQHAAKREDKWRLMEEKREAHIVKEIEMARLVETPVTSGPPKNQQAITHFFAREVAVARKKSDDSVRQRREKGLNWYSKMRKTPEEIKRMQFQIKRRMADKRREAAEIRDAKARKKRRMKRRPEGRMKRIRKEC
jgi:hypothetical protein